MLKTSQAYVTHLSEKGEILIPQSIRSRLNLHVGTAFVVVERGDTLILKMLGSPSAQFRNLAESARRRAVSRRLTRSDVESAVRRARV